MESRPVKVLVAPLDWGLGHATRCIPVIRELLERGAEVMISASGGGKILLAENFPDCKFIDIPGIKIRYPENGSMALSILFQTPAILKAIRNEHELLQRVVTSYGITHVISDNRYGLYSGKTKSVFISHQVHIKSGSYLKFLEPLLFRMNKSRIEKFDELWIPDSLAPNNLSGELSDTSGMTIPVKHIGILSRFTTAAASKEKKYDFIALLSGPEPQRSILEKKLHDIFFSSPEKCLLVRGTPGLNTLTEDGKIKIMSTISDQELQDLLHPETTLICRPGYSTLMDLAVLGHRNALFIPTPGQTEQEYLADVLKNKWGYTCFKQEENFSIEAVVPGKPLPEFKNQDALKKTIGEFLS
jgi:hypothetical protein